MENETNVRDVRWIESILPHRYPMLLVDRVLEIDDGKRIVAEKNFTINEWFFAGHFPGQPVVPGVILMEGMAQAAGILVLCDQPEDERQLWYLMSIDSAKFRRPVVPGDRVRFEIETLRKRKRHCKLRGRAIVDGQVVVDAICTSAAVDES